MNTEKLDKLEQQMKALQAELEKARAECQQKAWPKVGYTFWSFTERGVFDDIWQNVAIDRNRKEQHRIFRTKAEAQAAYEWTFSKRTAIRREVELCDGFDPSGHVTIFFDDGEITISFSTSLVYFADLSFNTEQQAQACIDTVGESRIKYLLTGEE